MNCNTHFFVVVGDDGVRLKQIHLSSFKSAKFQAKMNTQQNGRKQDILQEVQNLVREKNNTFHSTVEVYT